MDLAVSMPRLSRVVAIVVTGLLLGAASCEPDAPGASATVRSGPGADAPITGELRLMLATVGAPAWSPNGLHIATPGRPAIVWSSVNGVVIRSFDGAHEGAVLDVDFSPDGHMIALAGDDGDVTVWDVSTGSQQHRRSGHTAGAYRVLFSPDDSWRLASVGWDGTVCIWAWEAAEPLRLVSRDGIVRLAWSPDGSRLATTGAEVVIWDGKTGERLLTIETLASYYVAWSPDGTRVVTGGASGGAAQVWDVATGSLVHTLQGPGSSHEVAWSPDGTRIATGHSGRDAAVQIWDAGTGQSLYSLRLAAHTSAALAFSPDGTLLAVGIDEYTTLLFDASGTHVPVIGGDLYGASVTWAPDSEGIAAVGADGFVRVWD